MAVTPATQATTATRLGCGRDVNDLWDSIDQPPNEHERSCPYCTQARVNLAELSAATHEMTVSDQQNESLRVPDQMLTDVLAIVRTEVRRGRTMPLQRQDETRPAGPDAVADSGDKPSPAEPALTVSEQVVATVVRQTCDLNPDIEVRRVSIEATPSRTVAGRTANGQGEQSTPGPVQGGMPADVSIDLQATVSHTAAIPDLLKGLRRAIQAAVTSQIGVTVSRIDVDIQDLHDA